MAEDQHTSDRPARPLPECLTRLLTDSKEQIQPVTPYLGSDPKPRVLDRLLWWSAVVLFGAAAFITGAILAAKLLR